MVEDSEEEITHIQYADNTILFLNANVGDLSCHAAILQWLQICSCCISTSVRVRSWVLI